MTFARLLVFPEAAATEDPRLRHGLASLDVTDPILSSGLMPFAFGVGPEQGDFDLAAVGRRILGNVLRGGTSHSTGRKQSRMDNIGFARDGNDRFVFLRAFGAGEHLQLPLAQ